MHIYVAYKLIKGVDVNMVNYEEWTLEKAIQKAEDLVDNAKEKEFFEEDDKYNEHPENDSYDYIRRGYYWEV